MPAGQIRLQPPSGAVRHPYRAGSTILFLLFAGIAAAQNPSHLQIFQLMTEVRNKVVALDSLARANQVILTMLNGQMESITLNSTAHSLSATNQSKVEILAALGAASSASAPVRFTQRCFCVAPHYIGSAALPSGLVCVNPTAGGFRLSSVNASALVVMAGEEVNTSTFGMLLPFPNSLTSRHAAPTWLTNLAGNSGLQVEVAIIFQQSPPEERCASVSTYSFQNARSPAIPLASYGDFRIDIVGANGVVSFRQTSATILPSDFYYAEQR